MDPFPAWGLGPQRWLASRGGQQPDCAIGGFTRNETLPMGILVAGVPTKQAKCEDERAEACNAEGGCSWSGQWCEALPGLLLS
mmetsp:Transcript_44230/g.128012  ORF Transcript_44230/g.128012 Transcript_44230/m.128012 type:complete len:83 (+) Transcript_44230:431-679(+)